MSSIEWRKKLNILHARRSHLKASVSEERHQVDACAKAAMHANEAQRIVQQVALTVQQSAHERIGGVVSRCLEAVFDAPYEFRIVFERKRGKTEAKLIFRRDGLDVNPMTAAGGGAVDVAAFALRLSCLVLARPPLRRLLVLDEPFRFVSAEFQPRLRELLLVLAREMSVQFMIVTHNRELQTGKVIKIG